MNCNLREGTVGITRGYNTRMLERRVTSHFDGTLALMNPKGSWVASSVGLQQQCATPGLYAMRLLTQDEGSDSESVAGSSDTYEDEMIAASEGGEEEVVA